MNDRVSLATKARVAILLVFGLVHVLATAYLVRPGYLSIDETVYHWSSREFASRMSLDIRNGYEEHPSPELVHPFLRVHNGRLYSQYPPLFAVLAAPFYKLSGYYGLFVMNALAFVLVVFLCFLTAKHLFGDVDLALNAAMILCFATFAWEYSQASWPHMISCCFILGSFYLFVRSCFSAEERQRLLFAFAAGVVAGFAPGIRSEAICIFPLLSVPFACTRPLRFREFAMFFVGVLPGTGTLSWINYIRFDRFTPFADGNVSLGLGGIFAATLLVAGLAALITRPAVADKIARHKIVLWGAAVPALLLVILLEPARRFILDMGLNAFVSTIDIRFMPNVPVPGMMRGALGSVIYLGAMKKALLQSLPFLAILVLPLVKAFRSGPDSTPLRLLWLVPFMFIGFYAYIWSRFASYDGGKCLNMRYFVPTLPFLAIICAHALRDLGRRWKAGIESIAFILTGTVVLTFYILTVHVLPSQEEHFAYPLLVFPLLLAVLLLGLLCAGEFLRSSLQSLARRLFFVLVAAAFTWSGAVAFFYDYPRHTHMRWSTYFMGEAARTFVPRGAAVFTSKAEPAMRLIESDVILAFPHQDNFADFPALLDFQRRMGRRTFACFTDNGWRAVVERMLTQLGYGIVPCGNFRQPFLEEIVFRDGRAAGGGG